MTVDVRVCAREELAPGQCRFVEHGSRRVAVFHATDALFAIDDVCPHRGGPLSEGYLEGYLVTCPWHGWQYDVTTGKVPANQAVGVGCFTIEARGEDIWVDCD